MFVDGQGGVLVNPNDPLVWTEKLQTGLPGMSRARAFDGNLAEERLYRSTLDAETIAAGEIKMAFV